MISRILIALTILAVIVGSFFIGQSNSPEPANDAAVDRPEPDPGYAARDAEVIETDAEGREMYRLNAELIRQDPVSGVVELESIAMNYRTAEDALWKVNAQRGTVLEAGDRIDLEGKVRVTGPMPDTTSTIALDTESLTFETQQERISTDAPVTMTWTGHKLSSRGLSANLKDGRVQLKSSVHGRFTP